MDRSTGKTILDAVHLRQSIEDILTTPKGSRLYRREYGLSIDLIDAPLTPTTRMNIVVAVAEALRKWEPRISVKRVKTDLLGDGKLSLVIEYIINTSQLVKTTTVNLG